MRVATWNVQHGRRPDGVVDLELVGDTVVRLAADVVGLQELDVRVRRSGRIDQPGTIAAMAAMRHVFAPAHRLGLVGRYGLALLSRSPVTDVDVVRLPGDGEPRAVLLARTEGLSVAVTHLSQRRHDSAEQLAIILAHLFARPGPHVLLGDLNRRATEVDVLAARGLSVAGGPPTYPADDPRLRIDHVAVAGAAIGRVDVPSVPVSDHRPLVVELT